ncbi:Heme oxygenase 1 [Prochlorococcus marinus str. MIT 1320]|nr:Heme oxygenase 1 [Prochlorococcus marinus str. MIT 1320]
MAVALASVLSEGTKAAYTMAENTGFVSSLLKGVVDFSSYRNLVAGIGKVFFVDCSRAANEVASTRMWWSEGLCNRQI